MEPLTQKPQLSRLRDFQAVLADYHPSEHALADFKATKLIILVGPTAAGRNTLISLLEETGKYVMVTSDTTRPPRYNNGILETNGSAYWFKNEDEFLKGLKAGEYIEAAIIHNQQVSGIHVNEMNAARKSNKVAIKEIETQGAASLRNMKDDILSVFLLPPSFDIWMQRLRVRGEMAEGELRNRLESAYDEIVHGLESDIYTMIINSEIHDVAVVVDALVNGKPNDPSKQLAARNHAEQLALDVQLYLQS